MKKQSTAQMKRVDKIKLERDLNEDNDIVAFTKQTAPLPIE